MGQRQERAKRLIFAVKVSGGHENNVAKLIFARVKLRNLPVKSIIVSPKMRGYVLLESGDVHTVNEATYGIKNVKSVVPGVLTVDDIEEMIVKKKEAMEAQPGDIVEVISGPFKGMKARVVRFSKEKNEATINLIDVPYQLQVTVSVNYLKRASEG